MDYKRLIELDNQYPNLRNYKTGSKENTDVLKGIYADVNHIEFSIPTIDMVKYVPGTTFRFILSLAKDTTDINPMLYTSETYYKDLQSANVENNPYFIIPSFDPNYIVHYYYSDVLATWQKMKNLETGSAVQMHENIFINQSGTIDFDNLVYYIDWCVDKVNPLDTDTGGVLNATTIANWNYLDIDPLTGQVKETIKGNSNPSASLDTGSLSTTQSDLNNTQSQLNDILSQITAIQTEINTKANFKFSPNSANVSVAGFIFTSTISNAEKGNKVARINDLVNQLTAKINELKANQTKLQTNIDTLNSQISNVIGAIGNVQSGIAQASQLANQLNSNIGSIKNLAKQIPTSLPKLPAAPNLGALKSMALAAVPAIPKIPKKPSLKFPELPKLSLKKPKKPKKFKKAELAGALKDIQGSVSSLQNASTSVISQAQGLANKANGLASAVQNAAQNAVAGAISTVTSTANLLLVQATSVGTSAQSNIKSSANLSNIVGSSGQNSTDGANLGGLSQADIVAQKEAQIQSGTRYAKKLQDGTIRYIYNDPSSPTGYIYGDGTIVNKDD
jgi:peptidoglycan hydrolase CwlO-like protein